jgi:hypothetical protein
VLWSYTYGWVQDGGFYDVQAAPSGGYALAGQTDGKALLMVTDDHGDTVWTRVPGEGRPGRLNQVHATSDSCLIGVGTVQAEGVGEKIPLTKATLSGEILWEHALPSEGQWFGARCTERGNGGYAFAGTSTDRLWWASGSYLEIVLLETDIDGNQESQRTYCTPNRRTDFYSATTECLSRRDYMG